ncbi:M35 family metallo-endopeptidase [Microbulbifer sp. OS29]|uniref:M35 family metallo-endopeptidase n=1 Tax=Microbulbifer okhotskensis TaxID=2926617 RepID=A0A9X2EJW9_9GAMM|nr:M35 family metallo-endopeptidase [Microbulbifer okhotskensis]MCO1333592.1 M35 family metallo-endopeptidase [Microbulbifer okhotskensis]
MAEKGMSNRDDKTKTLFKKWFGIASKEEMEEVSAKIYRMNFYINNLPITLNDAHATLGSNTNAMATHVTSIGKSSYKQRKDHSSINGVKIDLTDRFFNSLKRIQSNCQTQIETLVHELSHLAAGTKDAPNGSCYGRVNALALASGNDTQRAFARNNAENYGFFVIAVGGEIPVHSQKAPIGSGRKWAVVEPSKLVR